MIGYKELQSQADIDCMLERAARLHDSLTKEFRVINRGYVTSDRSMVMGLRFDGQFLFQSQWSPFALEIVLSNILELHITDPSEHWSASGKFLQIGRDIDTAIELVFGEGQKVVAQRVFHADRSEWLGKRAFLGPELPCVDAVNATGLDGEWRQCSACGDAWQEQVHLQFSLCSGCGRLTELVRD